MLVPAERFELPTNGLQNRCSTTELSRHGGWSAECKSSARTLKTPDARACSVAPARGSGLPGTRPARFPPGGQCVICGWQKLCVLCPFCKGRRDYPCQQSAKGLQGVPHEGLLPIADK